jgi:hypothetical protein
MARGAVTVDNSSNCRRLLIYGDRGIRLWPFVVICAAKRSAAGYLFVKQQWMLTMLIWLVPGVLSCIYRHKKRKLASKGNAVYENQLEAGLPLC